MTLPLNQTIPSSDQALRGVRAPLFTRAARLLPANDQQGWAGDEASMRAHADVQALTGCVPSPETFWPEYREVFSTIERLPERYDPNPGSLRRSLPKPTLTDFAQISLIDVLARRKTTRQFRDDREVSQQALANLLFAAFGNIHKSAWTDFEARELHPDSDRRSSPSASALPVFDAYLAVRSVTGIASGYYRYLPGAKASLQLIQASDAVGQELTALCNQQSWSANLGACIFLVGDLRRVWIKDRSTRAYAHTYVEAGHLSQTLQLVATALNLQTWITGAFADQALEQQLRITPEFLFASFAVGVGHGVRTALPEDLHSGAC